MYLPEFSGKNCELNQEEKIHLVMSGITLGDMIGVPYEYMLDVPEWLDPDTVTLITDKSHFSDDTVMSVAILDASMQLYCKRTDQETAVKAYADTMRKYAKKWPDEGYGSSFYLWAVCGEDDDQYQSYGNGSAMRSGVIGAVFDDVTDVITYSYYSALPTHSHPEGIKGAVVTAVCVWMALHGAEKKDILEYVKRYYQNGFRTREEHFEDGREYMDPEITIDELKELDILSASVICQLTIPEAIANFMNSDSYEGCIRNALRYPCDTDTVGAISGGIAAAYYKNTDLSGYITDGYNCIDFPEQYLSKERIIIPDQ